jgi:hypothetical protein
VSDRRAILIVPDISDLGTALLVVSYAAANDLEIVGTARDLVEANVIIEAGGAEVVVARSPRYLMPYPVEIADEPGWWMDDAPPGQRRPRRTRRVR